MEVLFVSADIAEGDITFPWIAVDVQCVRLCVVFHACKNTDLTVICEQDCELRIHRR
jgi:hypothetical protein